MSLKIALTTDLHYGFSSKTEAKLIKFLDKELPKAKKYGIDLFIVSGDLASTKQRQFEKCLALIRNKMDQHNIDVPFALVRGNHDLWNDYDKKNKEWIKSKFLVDLYKKHEEWFVKYKVRHLDNALIIKDTLICGFDGWYSTSDPKTNDADRIPKDVGNGHTTMNWLITKTWKDFDSVLELSKTAPVTKKILVTHHNLYLTKKYGENPHNGITKFLPEVKANFDVLVCGHTHIVEDRIEDNLRIINAGSDYNQPVMKFLEIK